MLFMLSEFIASANNSVINSSYEYNFFIHNKQADLLIVLLKYCNCYKL